MRMSAGCTPVVVSGSPSATEKLSPSGADGGGCDASVRPKGRRSGPNVTVNAATTASTAAVHASAVPQNRPVDIDPLSLHYIRYSALTSGSGGGAPPQQGHPPWVSIRLGLRRRPGRSPGP